MFKNVLSKLVKYFLYTLVQDLNAKWDKVSPIKRVVYLWLMLMFSILWLGKLSIIFITIIAAARYVYGTYSPVDILTFLMKFDVGKKDDSEENLNSEGEE